MVAGICYAAAGGSLVGSNYIFKIERLVDIPQDGAENKWEEKLPILLKKIIANSGLSVKIDPQKHSSNLAKTGASGSEEFSNKNDAKASLKAWCKKENKQTGEKEHEEELCKESVKKEWLFG
ncbi:hypothetical protein A6V39_04725 [Candidatus Mycoplasma haematobovis]|uniref:Uncharacterized protein n=1 Tax=Candidatus Mycoplasma haematobovis TaxID=432608 RepID=A0A1A9QD22_9MOLU|nr:hypothetical protein [Candidatus Mycoplasma haematobovis]OAL09855.1 hypothetical protein A6V39_04725 [Candidatus Mycoplasma haematobovis]